jgi:hypothetical protein
MVRGKMSTHKFPRSAVAIAALIAAMLMGSAANAASRLALVVGNDAYVPRFRLPSCVNDARRMSQWLQTVGYEKSEIRLLTDATRVQMVSALDDLVRQAETQRPEQVFLYYSGHGLAIEDDNDDEGDDDHMDEAFVAIDDPSGVASVDQVVVRDDLFYSYTNRLAKVSGQVFIVLDCCYSGGLAKSLPKDLEHFQGVRAPAKFIHATELEDYLAGKPAAKGIFKVPDAGTKSIGAKETTAELQQVSAKRGVVFLSASNQFQLSRAGDTLSVFTEAFIRAVEDDREKLTTDNRAFTLAILRDELAAKLKNIPQSPVLECRPAELALEKDPFIPGLFPTPTKWEEEQHATAIVAQLLALPEDRRDASWKITATPTHRPPLAVGEKFAIEVNSNADGYLVMFTVGASGKVTFLFPNRFRNKSEVKAGGSALLPYRDGLKVQPPVGAELFYVYLLESNPFEEFDFSQSAGAMAAGDLEGVLRQHPKLREHVARLTPKDLNEAQARGMIVERVADALRAEANDLQLFPGGKVPHWTSVVLKIDTVE